MLIIEGCKKMNLVKGSTYTQDSRFKSVYKVLDVYMFFNGSIDALLQNVESGWTFMALGIRFNGDLIYWAYGSNGHFMEVE